MNINWKEDKGIWKGYFDSTYFSDPIGAIHYHGTWRTFHPAVNVSFKADELMQVVFKLDELNGVTSRPPDDWNGA